ncbi:MAG: iron chelate uptake ABC transporter family permease subunit [Caldimicrobium sp.]|jgi:iron complex transport system permease protein|nr:iron chelate uptake ABC transporter family permease subunit [Caldimicrobium sp.]
MSFKWSLGLFLLFLMILLAFLSISYGSVNISFLDVMRLLFQKDREEAYIVWEIRLPRTIGGILTGASLGVSGAVMQNVLQNPLASPFTLGISHGAAFGAAFAIIVLGAGKTFNVGPEGFSILQGVPVVFSAFCGALLTVLIILGLSLLRSLSPQAIILAGVALSSLFTSATMFLQYFSDEVRVASTVFWTFGDVGKAGWQENKIMALTFCISFALLWVNRWNYNAMLWGDETAKNLGTNPKFLRIFSLLICAILTAVPTAFLGIIGFVGLISPHIIRLLIGNDYTLLIPFSAMAGAGLLLASDLLARTILSPIVLPVGIITSFIGAPVFLTLLLRRNRF